MRLFSILTIAALAASSLAQTWVTNPANGHRYTLVSDNSSWSDAENEAVALGGHLVTINDLDENQWVVKEIAAPVTISPVWIGLHQLPNSLEPGEGWTWSSGEAVTFTNWADGEPNQYLGLIEDWAEMYIADVPIGGWNDVNLSMTRVEYGVVEVVPEPATIGILGLSLAFVARRSTTRPRRLGVTRRR